MNAATINGTRVTSARVNIPAWGCWYADVQVDGEVTITGSVTVQIADLTLKGTVLSGGPAKGRSAYRVVAGAGGWGRTLKAKPYSNDAGVKAQTVLGDAASEAGESLAGIDPALRVGPGFVRAAGPALGVLQQVAPSAWYVDEAGVTRLGARAATSLGSKVTRVAPVDQARGRVTLAATSIATILPGVSVDGLMAVDVLHEMSASKGLRSTLWGSQTGGALGQLAQLAAHLDPDRAFRGVVEYRVVTRSGSRLNLQPVRSSLGMPDLPRVIVRPGVAGCETDVAIGSRVLVGFVDSDPTRPYVAAFEDADGEGFQPTSLSLLAGGAAGGERVMTTEATALLIYNTLVAVMAAAGGGPLLAAVLQPLLGTAVNAALAAQSAPAPPGEIAQEALAATLLASFATGTVPANTSAFFNAAIAAGAGKTPNVSGKFPGLGSTAVETG